MFCTSTNLPTWCSMVPRKKQYSAVFEDPPLQCFRLLQSSLIITRAVGRLHRLERIQGLNSARDLAMPTMTPIPDQVVEKERNRNSNKKNGQHGSTALRRT